MAPKLQSVNSYLSHRITESFLRIVKKKLIPGAVGPGQLIRAGSLNHFNGDLNRPDLNHH